MRPKNFRWNHPRGLPRFTPGARSRSMLLVIQLKVWVASKGGRRFHLLRPLADFALIYYSPNPSQGFKKR